MHDQRLRRHVEERELQPERAVQDSSVLKAVSSLPCGVLSSLYWLSTGGDGFRSSSASLDGISVSATHVEMREGEVL